MGEKGENTLCISYDVRLNKGDRSTNCHKEKDDAKKERRNSVKEGSDGPKIEVGHMARGAAVHVLHCGRKSATCFTASRGPAGPDCFAPWI